MKAFPVSFRKIISIFVLLSAGSGLLTLSWAYDPNEYSRRSQETPAELQGLGIEEHLGESIDLALTFSNEEGQKVALQDYFQDKPVLLTLVYYRCPNLCNWVLDGIQNVLADVKWTIGKDFEFVVVSIDPDEGPDLASEKKKAHVEKYGRPGAADGWHFLTGTSENIEKLAEQVGFKYRWNEEAEQWAHAAASYVLTPTGVISRYLYGIEFKPNDVRLALVEAGQGQVGGIIDQVILFCFRFDPDKGGYSLYAYNVLRAGAGATVAVLAMFLVPFWIRQRRKQREIKE